MIIAAAGGYVFAAKGGHNDEPHNHNDIGPTTIIMDNNALVMHLISH